MFLKIKTLYIFVLCFDNINSNIKVYILYYIMFTPIDRLYAKRVIFPSKIIWFKFVFVRWKNTKRNGIPLKHVLYLQSLFAKDRLRMVRL